MAFFGINQQPPPRQRTGFLIFTSGPGKFSQAESLTASNHSGCNTDSCCKKLTPLLIFNNGRLFLRLLAGG